MIRKAERVKVNLDHCILCKANVDMINLQRDSEAGASAGDKNNEKEEKRGENLIYGGLIRVVSQSWYNEAIAKKK